MKAIWLMIRRHPVATAFVGFVGIAPLHAGFVANMRTDPIVAWMFMTALWGCGIPILLGLVAMQTNAIWPLNAKPDGRCPTCGYDLRASPERCPECGTDVAAEKAGHE